MDSVALTRGFSKYIYSSFFERSTKEFSLQRGVLICIYFSINEPHFYYNEQLNVQKFGDIYG
jgi:hypothetical protein